MTPKTRQVLLDEAKSTYERQVSYIDFLYNQEKDSIKKKEASSPRSSEKALPVEESVVEDEGFLYVPKSKGETYINLPANVGGFNVCDAMFEVVHMFHEKGYPTLFARDIIFHTSLWRFHENHHIPRSTWKVIQAKIFPRIGIMLVGKSQKYAVDRSSESFNRILAEILSRRNTKYSAENVFSDSGAEATWSDDE
jgi:hypothetical protein